jgi:hypothetical protein
MRIGNLHSRLRALEKRRPDPTQPSKAFLPAWLLADFKEQGYRFDDAGRPVFRNSQPVMEVSPCE